MLFTKKHNKREYIVLTFYEAAMIKILKLLLIGIYVAWVFSLGILMSILRPLHPNIVYYTTKLLAWKGLAILGIEFEKRDLNVHQNIGPAVYCCNHQNNIDMIPGGACVQKRTVVLGKKSIIWIPFFGQFFWLSGNIMINRSNPAKAKESMKMITDKIKNKNISVWIMPEGTRSRGKGLLPFKKGAFITAINAQVPIAPVVLSSYAESINLNKLKSGKIISKCLPLIPTVGMTKEDVPRLMEQTHQTMKRAIQELDEELAHSRIVE